MPETEIAVETPLHYFRDRFCGLKDCGVLIRESALMGHLNLRGNADNPEFLRAVETVMAVPLPVKPCTCANSDQGDIYWLGPDEWLLIVVAARASEVESRLRQTLPGHVSLVDVSAGQTLVNLSGAAVGTLLKKSSHYDFHPANFGPGRCVQTNFAKAAALVSQREDGSFDLVIRRSFADYLARWLLDAGSNGAYR